MQQSTPPPPPFPPHSLLVRATDEVNSAEAEVVRSKERGEMSGPKGQCSHLLAHLSSQRTQGCSYPDKILNWVYSTAGDSTGHSEDRETSCPTDLCPIDLALAYRRLDRRYSYRVEWAVQFSLLDSLVSHIMWALCFSHFLSLDLTVSPSFTWLNIFT